VLLVYPESWQQRQAQQAQAERARRDQQISLLIVSQRLQNTLDRRIIKYQAQGLIGHAAGETHRDPGGGRAAGLSGELAAATGTAGTGGRLQNTLDRRIIKYQAQGLISGVQRTAQRQPQQQRPLVLSAPQSCPPQHITWVIKGGFYEKDDAAAVAGSQPTSSSRSDSRPSTPGAISRLVC
jgi:hypothetical protein